MTMEPGRFRLLHIEDNELDARALSRALKKLGVDQPQDRACDGIEALDYLRHDENSGARALPIIILLDINMPRMNGLEFLQELRGDTALRHLPVFVLTTSEQDSDIRTAYDHNVAGYIVKPIESEDYVDRIQVLHQLMSVIELPQSD